MRILLILGLVALTGCLDGSLSWSVREGILVPTPTVVGRQIVAEKQRTVNIVIGHPVLLQPKLPTAKLVPEEDLKAFFEAAAEIRRGRP